MIIHKQLKLFLEIIQIKNMDFTYISERGLKEYFKNNEYYQLKKFCLENDLITCEYRQINLTSNGLDFFKILKKCRNL